MSETEIKTAAEQFFKSHDSLSKAAELRGQEIYVEILSNRFRLCYETLRSCLKRLMIYLGTDETLDSSWKIFETAITHGLVSQNQDWFAIIMDRNTLAHDYFEPVMLEICERIETLYLPLFAEARQVIQTQLQKYNI